MNKMAAEFAQALSRELPTNPKVGEALHWGSRVLAASGSETPRLDAELLLGYVLGLSRSQLYVHWEEPLSPKKLQHYQELVQRRAQHEPVAYLVKSRAFYDVELYVDARVLIPRPETEHLIEEALAWAQQHPGYIRQIADVGTGSGALAIVLARHLPQAHVWAVDLSAQALSVAARNIARYQLETHITLIQGDLLTAFRGPFQLIVANLPYIDHAELSHLPPEVATYEPRLALNGGQEGLEILARFLPQAAECLAAHGLLLLEIDPRQAAQVCKLARASFPKANITLLRDYAGWERVVRIAYEG